jgi:malate permease and related proteins
MFCERRKAQRKHKVPNLLMLAFCLVAGIALNRTAKLPDNAHAALNGVILHVSLPALTLRYLHDFKFDAGYPLAVLMPWLLFALGAAAFFVLGRALRLPRPTVGALILVGGLGNTSFVGLPMIESLYGTAGLPLGLLVDQLGSYLALSTAGVIVATTYARQAGKTAPAICRKVFTFPPFVAMVLALASYTIEFPAAFSTTLVRLGDTVAPLALLSVGLQLRFGALREHAKALCLGLGYKLLMCPALAIGVLWVIHAKTGMSSHVMVIESAMPPMIGAGVVAIQAKLDPDLVTLMIGLGIPIGFSTVPAWHWLYRAIAS